MTRNKRHQCLQGPELPEIYPNSPAKTPLSVSPVLHPHLAHLQARDIRLGELWTREPRAKSQSRCSRACSARVLGQDRQRDTEICLGGPASLTSKGHSEKDVYQAARVVRPSTSLERHPTPRHSVSASGLTSPSEGGSATQRKKKMDEGKKGVGGEKTKKKKN